MKTILCIIISLAVLFCVFSSYAAASPSEEQKPEYPEKTGETIKFSSIDYDDSYQSNEHVSETEFEPGVILVSLKNAYTKEFVVGMIPGVNIIKIDDFGEKLYQAVKKGRPEDKESISKLEHNIGKNYVLTISDKSNEGVLKAIDILKKDSNVLSATPNYILEPCVTPNDYTNYNLWGMDRIQAPMAWSEFTGSSSVNVGIIDTGIDYTHPDLSSNINMSLAYDAQNENTINVMDYNSHGTHVAGIVGARGNNSIGVTGVNWNVKLVPIKIAINDSDTGSAYTTAMINAIDYAIEKNLPICNLSYSTPSSDLFYNSVSSYNGLLVMAAGNDNKNIDLEYKYTRLNNLGNVIFVANSNDSTGTQEKLASSSNYGLKNCAIAAPGCDIYSTVPGGGYASKTGTSMASPYVAGVAALIKGKYPSITTTQLKEAILDGANFVPMINGLVQTGRLNARNSIYRTYDISYLVCRPNNGETMKAAILRCLAGRPAALVLSLKLVGDAFMDTSSNSTVSASSALPNLVNVDFSSFEGSIETAAFHGCNKITTAIFPESNVYLPAYAFMYCSSLKTIYKANYKPRIINEADLSSLRTTVSPSGAFAGQTQCFQGCSALTTVKLSNKGRIRFAQFSFKDCTSLKTVYTDTFDKILGEADLTNMTQIGTEFFENTGIESVRLPKDVNLGDRAFKNCSGLKTIQVYPAQISTTTVGSEAFYNVNSSCIVYTNKQLQSNSSYVFYRSSSITIPKQINSLVVWPDSGEEISVAINRHLGSTSCSLIKHLVVNGTDSLGTSSSSNSAKALPNLETVDLSSYSGSLSRYMFYNCTNLKTVIRSTSHTSVPAFCFKYCNSLKTIIVGNKYPSIGNEADLSDLSGGLAVNTDSFAFCESIKTLRFPSISIGIPGAFYGCSNLSTIYVDGLEKIDGVFDLTRVSTFWSGWGSNFYHTKVSEVKLPKNVDVAEKMFKECTNLKKISFDATQTMSVTIGLEAFYGVSSSCKAYMNSALVSNTAFVLPRSVTEYIPKYAY